jgi:precorrin-4 methylase
MSERIQRNARARRDAARERAEKARERAARNRSVGDARVARLHEGSAAAHDAAADAAEELRQADIAVEGDKA